MKVLFFSSMVVSPAGGGGNAAFNLLESGPEWGEILYATPTHRPSERRPFPEITPRIRSFSNVNRPLPQKLEAAGRMRWIGKLVERVNDWVQRETVVRDVARCARREGVDVLLVCPQNAKVDLPAAPEVVERTGLPSVAWFMDDYFEDGASRGLAGRVWGNAHRRFVASESMRERFSDLYGGECEMINNAVAFPERYPEPTDEEKPRLRIVYAGAMNSYYLSAMSSVLGEIEGLGDRVELDIYSPDEMPPEWVAKDGSPWRHLPPVPPAELGELLQGYDVLLLLSSFEPGWRTVAETAQAGKMADYLAAGRCILAYGPHYADNVRYLSRYGIGEAVTSQASGALRGAVLDLLDDPARCRRMGERAYHFGKEHRDRAVYSARLWRALSEAASSPPPGSNHGPLGVARLLVREMLFVSLNALGGLKRAVRKVVKG